MAFVLANPMALSSSLTLRERNQQSFQQPSIFPKLLEGGNHLIAPGIVVPPGMRIRNPALLNPRHFSRALKEILQVWSTTPKGYARDVLSERVATMWLRFQYFKRVATYAYLANKRRTKRQAESFIRFTCFAPNANRVSVKLSPLATIKDVKRILGRTRTAKCRNAHVGDTYVVLLDGEPVDDAMCLEDAGVRASTTLVLTVAAPETDDVLFTKRPLASTSERRRSSLTGGTGAAPRPAASAPRTRAAHLDQENERIRATWSRSALPSITSFGPARPSDEDLLSRPTTASGTSSRPQSRPGTSSSSRPATPGFVGGYAS